MASSDPENAMKGQHVEDHDDVKSTHRSTKQRTAALLSVLSLILLADAVYRVNNVAGTPKGHWDQEGSKFAPIVLLLAGVFELLFSTLGLVVGFGWILFDFELNALTMVLMASQLVLGTFTYFIFTLVWPAYMIERARFTPQTRTVASVFGWIITAMGYSGVLQAGQFLLTMQFSRLQTGVAKLGNSYFRMRLLLLSFLVILAGLGTFICGVIVRQRTVNDLSGKRAYFPGVMTLSGSAIFGDFNAVRWPSITIVSGALEMLFALMLMAAAFVPGLFYMCTMFGALVWGWLVGAHILAMYGLISAALSMQAVLTALLSTALVVVPLYYLKEVHRSKDT